MFAKVQWVHNMLTKDNQHQCMSSNNNARHQLHGDHTWLRLMRWPQQVQYSEGGSNVSRLSPQALH